MSTVSVVDTLNQFFTTKYPGLFLLLLAIAFAWFTTSHLNSLDRRVGRIENVDLPEIREDIKEVRQDIKEVREDVRNLDIRATRLEVKVDGIEKKLDDLTVEVKELRADVKQILLILAKQNP